MGKFLTCPSIFYVKHPLAHFFNGARSRSCHFNLSPSQSHHRNCSGGGDTLASRKVFAVTLPLVMLSALACSLPSRAVWTVAATVHDQLFDASQFSIQSGVIYVMPQRKLKNVQDVPTSGGNLNSRPNYADDTTDYAVPYLGLVLAARVMSIAWWIIPSSSARIPTRRNRVMRTTTSRRRLIAETMAPPAPINSMSAPASCAIGVSSIREIEASQKSSLSFLRRPSALYSGVGRLDLSDES